MKKFDVVFWMALAGCVLTIVIALLGSGYDARATFTREPTHYLPLLGVITALAAVFVWRWFARARNE